MNTWVPIVLTASEQKVGFRDNLGLVFLTLFVFALAYWATRVLSRQTKLKQRTNAMKVVERLSLGKDRQIMLVQVGNKHYLAGVTHHSITLSEAVEMPDFASIMEPLLQERPETLSQSVNTRVFMYKLGSWVRTWIEKVRELLHAISSVFH